MSLIKSRFDFIRTFSFKLFVIGLLVLVFAVVMLAVFALVYDRSDRQGDVVREVSQKWGDQQLLLGPILAVPYATGSENYAYLLPEKLNIESNAKI